MLRKKKELIELIRKYRLGKASLEEIKFLEKYYQYFNKEEKISESLTEYEIKETRDKIIANIQGSIQQAPVIPLYKRLGFRLAAASVLLIVSFSIYYLSFNKNHQSPDTNTVVTNHDVAPPAINRATITLANGQKVYLDSAENGILATQGNINVKKLEDGQIVYNVESSLVNSELVYNTLTNPKGSKVIDITLNDGTKVWLNAGSSLTYPVAFVGNERKVTMSGEAYFEVATLRLRSGQKMPFKVKINESAEVEVLGTHFNINAYSDEASINTTLLEGSVRVTANKKNQLLKPGQQVQVNVNAIKLITDADVAQAVAWKEGLFSFRNADLATVVRQIARWYDVDVEYHGEIKPKKFGGEIQRDLNLSEVLEGLKETGIHFRVEGKKLIVLP